MKTKVRTPSRLGRSCSNDIPETPSPAWTAGRRDLLRTSFETFERNIRDQLGRALADGGFDPARDIQGITVNRWPHGYAYEHNPLFDPDWSEEERPWVIGRKPFGRIAIANSDAAAAAYTDAAIDQAVEGIVNGIFFNQGHVCCAGSRLLVQESVADEVVQKLKDRMETLIVGDPLDKNTDIGAINSPEQLATIESYLAIGQDEGGEMFQSSCPVPDQGYWCRPTILTGVSQSNRVVQDEIFGPVLAIQTFRTFDEAVSKANNTPYGLSGGIWTDKGAKIFKMTQSIRAGVIWANTFNKFDPTSPFGGYKESGVGREGGMHGLDAYLKLEA